MDKDEHISQPNTNSVLNPDKAGVERGSGPATQSCSAASLQNSNSSSSDSSDTSSSDESSTDSESDDDFKCSPHTLLKNSIYPWWFMRDVSEEDENEQVNFPSMKTHPTLSEPYQSDESVHKHFTSKYLTDLRFTQLNALIFGGRWSCVVRLCDELLFKHLSPESPNSKLTNVLQAQLCEAMAISILKLTRMTNTSITDKSAKGLSSLHALPYALSLMPSQPNLRIGNKKALESKDSLSSEIVLPSVDWAETNISGLEILSRVALSPNQFGLANGRDVISGLEFLLRAVAIHVRAPILWQKVSSLLLSILLNYLNSLPNFKLPPSQDEFVRLLDKDTVAETLSLLCYLAASRACALVIAMLMTPRSDKSVSNAEAEKKQCVQHELSEGSQVAVLRKIIVEENFGRQIAHPVDIYPDIPWPCYPIDTDDCIAKIDETLDKLGIHNEPLAFCPSDRASSDNRNVLAALIRSVMPSRGFVEEAMQHKDIVYQVVRANPRKVQKEKNSDLTSLQSDLNQLSVSDADPDILQTSTLYIRLKNGISEFIGGLIERNIHASDPNIREEFSDAPLKSYNLAKDTWGSELLFSTACNHMRAYALEHSLDCHSPQFDSYVKSTSQTVSSRIVSLFVGSLMSVGQAGRCIITNLCTDFKKTSKLNSAATPQTADEFARAERARQRENPMNL